MQRGKLQPLLLFFLIKTNGTNKSKFLHFEFYERDYKENLNFLVVP